MLTSFRLDFRQRVVAMAVGALLCGVVAGVAALVLGTYGYAQRSTTTLDTLRRDLQTRRAEVLRTISTVEHLTEDPCSRAFVRSLQTLVVTSRLIQDILFHRDGMLCSAAFDNSPFMYEGAIDNASGPISMSADGVESRRHMHFRFASTVDFSMFTRGPVSIVLQSSGFVVPDEVGSGHSTALAVNRMTGEISRFSGAPVALGIDQLVDRTLLLRPTVFHSIACLRGGEVCLVLTTSYWSFLRARLFMFAFFVLLGSVCGLALASAFLAWLARRRTIAAQLRGAIHGDQLFLLYQPIADAQTGRIVAAEALVRWTLPNGSSVPPDVFIPVAEAANLVNEITCRVVRYVARDMADLLHAWPDFIVSINITAADLNREEFHTALIEHIECAGIRPEQIAFEITERQEMKAGEATARMARLRQRGYRFYIDDFGTGYSSISYLDELPIDAIKVDRSFTVAAGTDIARSRLVRPILDMARELGIPVIVEGVETRTQVDFFRTNSVARMQGYLFGAAMHPRDLMRTLDRQVVPDRPRVEAGTVN